MKFSLKQSDSSKLTALIDKLRGHLVPIAVIVALSVVFMFVYNLDLKPEIDPELMSVKYPQEARLFSQKFSEQLAPIINAVDALANDPATLEKFTDIDEWTVMEPGQTIPYMLRARLIRNGKGDIDTTITPHMSYACLDMVRSAEQQERNPPLEVHLFSTPQQHIDIARRIVGSDGQVAGTLLVNFNVTLFQEFIREIGYQTGYIEVQQGRGIVLAFTGDRSLRLQSPITTGIKGTRWRIAYWPLLPGADTTISDARNTLIIVAFVVILILALAGMYLFRARAAKKKRQEEVEQVQEEGASMLESELSIMVKASESHVNEDMETDVLFQNTGVVEVVEDGSISQESSDDISEGPRPQIEIPASIFRAYDIRGVVDDTLTPDIVYEIGRAIGSEAHDQGQKVLVVARDGRNSGPELIDALKRGLMMTGRTVIDIGMVPTPVLYFATHHLKTGSGVMLTGSHNPAQYNGLKIILNETTLSSDKIQSLYQRLTSGKLYSDRGTSRDADVIQDYLDRITNDILILKGFKVVVDCGNGVAGVIAPRLMRELNCEVTELFCDVDGNFPNHHPDPGKPENLQDLIKAVKEQKADLGLAFDGDGDRLGVVTSDGDIVWPDRLMMMFAKDILARNPGAEIIYDVKCSANVGKVIKEHGGKATMYKTGHSFIKAKMKESGALLAGEMSGHIFFKERWYGFDDATYSAARLLEILVLQDDGHTTTAEMFSRLPDAVNTPELNIQMAEGENFEFMKKMAANADFGDASMVTIDGLRADYPDGWGLVRASNTTPVLVLRFEADNEAALQRIQARFREQMLKINPEMSLPF